MNMAQEQTEAAPTDPWQMSSEQVGAKLKQLTADYERSKRSDDPHSRLRDRYDGHANRFDNLMAGSGLPDQAIHDFISGAPVEQSFRDQVAAWKSRSMKDSAFVKDYLAGESDAVRRMTVANAVLISPIKESAA
jgi:hypothetical protein